MYCFALCLTLVLRGGGWWVVNAKPPPIYHWYGPSTICIGCWLGHNAGLDGCAKSFPKGNESPDSPPHSSSLHQLCYTKVLIKGRIKI